MKTQIVPVSAFCFLLSALSLLPRPNAVAQRINDYLRIFGGDIAAFIFPGSGARRGNGNEFDLRCVFAETAQRPAGVKPGGDDDDAFALMLTQEFDGEERVLLRARGLAFEFDDVRGGAELLQ